VDAHPNGIHAERPSSTDVDLLWAAASPYPVPAKVAALAGRADLGRVLQTAIDQRVGPLVLRALRQAGTPDDALGADALADEAVWRGHARLALPAAASAALGTLDYWGLAPMVLKGLALAERYPALGLRPMDDIDLLVPRHSVLPATRLLEHAGWRRAAHFGRGPVGYDVPFVHPGVPGIPIELHYEFAEWRERSPALSGRRLWALRRPASVFGHEAYVLPPDVEIVAVLAHAAKGFHCFRRLLWIADVVVITRTATIDWDEVARVASDAKRRIVTAIGLTHARRLGADVPREMTTLPTAISRAHAVQALLDQTRPFTVAGAHTWTLPYALTDDVPGIVRRAIGDVRNEWETRGARGVRELFAFFLRGLPRLLRSRIAPPNVRG
jgi:hypothetical protein